MAKIKLGVHPLFYLFGLYFALTGKVFSFIAFALVSVCHEIGHAVTAEARGYRLNKITLMPYGCVISGETQCFSYEDEIAVALAGPATNLLTVVFFLALWWVFPESYPFTELAVFASLTIASINLLPCFPLDGGRALLAALSLSFERKKALFFCRILGVSLSVVFFAAFAYSCFIGVNFTLLFFGLFMLAGNVRVSKENDYVRLSYSLSQAAAERGEEVKLYAVGVRTPVKRLFAFKRGLSEVRIISNGRVIKALSVSSVLRLKNEGKIYSSIYSEAERLRL